MSAEKTEHIKSRRSVRRYRQDPVPEEVIRDILDCGHLAPSGHNRQPWLLGAVTDPILLKELADLVENARFIQQGMVCFIVFAKGEEEFYLEDGCAAAMNIIYACEAHGLGACWVAGARQVFEDAVRGLLYVPKHFKLVALIPAGFPDKVPSPVKRQLDDVMFLDRFTPGIDEPRPQAVSARFSMRGRLRHLVRGLLLKWF